MCTGVGIKKGKAAVGVMATLGHRRHSQKSRHSKSKLGRKRKRKHLPKKSPMLSNHIDYGPENKQCTASSDSVLRQDESVIEIYKETRDDCNDEKKVTLKFVLKQTKILCSVMIASAIPPMIASRVRREMIYCEDVTQNSNMYYTHNVSSGDYMNVCCTSEAGLGVFEYAFLIGCFITFAFLPLVYKQLTVFMYTCWQGLWGTETVIRECGIAVICHNSAKSCATRLSEYMYILCREQLLVSSVTYRASQTADIYTVYNSVHCIHMCR